MRNSNPFRSGFTLVELLVVIGLMGLLATLSIGGYNAASRGMEERGVRESVISLLRLAQQRSLIDGQPVMVLFYNQRLREEGELEAELSVGTAVAVRMAGRISYVDGSFVCDEFSDWENSYPEDGHTSDPEMRLYRMQNVSGNNVDSYCSYVQPYVTRKQRRSEYMIATDSLTNSYFFAWGLQVKGGATGWKVGDPYGFEIANLQLPHGYIFGSSKPTDEKARNVLTMYFAPESVSGSQYTFSGMTYPTISALRSGSGGTTVEKLYTVSASDLKE